VNTKQILTESQKISIEDSGVIVCVNLNIKRHTLAHAKQNLEAIRSLAGGVKRPVLIDIRETLSIDADARKYYSSVDYAEVQSAAALIIGSSLTRMIANFFMGLNKPLFPTKMFTDEAQAYKWLEEFLPND
jgi:hypothetical protein